MVARVLSLTLVVAASGRSLSLRRGRGSSEPWEGSTDFMDQYSADTEKAFHQNGRAAQEMDAVDAKQAADEPWKDVHASDKQNVDASSAAPTSVSDAWLKPSSDSWAFMPRTATKSHDDAVADVPEEPHADPFPDHAEPGEEHANQAEHADSFELSPGTADFWKPAGAMDWETELRSARKQTSDAWGMAPHKQSAESWEMAPRTAVHQAVTDASQAPHISSDVSSSSWGTHSSSDVSSDDSSDVENSVSSKESSDGAAVKIHAGSLGGMFDGGEDRGSHKHGAAAGESAAQAPQPPASSHAGGAVVDVRLDSELQESRRSR